MEVICLYEMEISPKEILSLMKDNIYNYNKEQTSFNIDKNYILRRKHLFSLIQKISKKIGFKSQTFFMAINYLDIIFRKENDIIYNYNLLAIGCLIIASKFCENVPLRPIFKHFVNLYNNEVKDDNLKVTKEDLFEYEIIICKFLNYKLNYYTIYDFNFFFFGNGIIKIEQLKKLNYDITALNLNSEINDNNSSTNISNNSSTNISNSSSQIKKLLIKIYERSRHYLDIIIENLICLKYNSLLISICIMENSIDYVLLKENQSINENKLIDIDEIRLRNKKYFRQIMKDFYKINFESLPEYENLKIECKNYKLFEDIYDKDNIKNKENINLIKIKNNNLQIENDSSSKNLKIIKDVAYKHSPTIRNKEAKDKLNFLYKKANVQIFSQKNNAKRKYSPKKRTSVSNFKEKLNNHSNNSKIIITSKDFYIKNKDIYRNSTSNNKNNYYLKKSNTSSSPFKKISQFNTTNIKSKIINKIKYKNEYRLENSEEGIIIDNIDSNSNSIDAKRYDLKDSDNKININKNNIVKITKPYIKKVIQNYEKNEDKKNININININNKILYGRSIRHKERNKSSKKEMISKYLNQSNCSVIRGKSIVNKSRIENYNHKKRNNFESSPIYEKNITNYNYLPFKFNKKEYNKNDISINQYNYKSINEENDNDNDNNNNIEFESNKQNNKIYKTNYNIYNSSLTSRNSYQYSKHSTKLTDSFANSKFVNLNKEKGFENFNVNNYTSLNFLKNKNKLFQKRNNENLNRTNNNSIYESNNYIENYKIKRIKINNNFQNETSNSININIDDINEKENYMEINNTNYNLRPKNFSNINIHDY